MKLNRGFVMVVLLVLVALLFAGCSASGDAGAQAVEAEAGQQGQGVLDIVLNQPVPDLGGFSRERSVVNNMMLQRNREVATWTYIITREGVVIEVCPSISYPIPYSTQLTNPEMIVDWTTQGGYAILPQPEPNSLYSPESASATWVTCVVDGQKFTGYMEIEVNAFPFRIKADRVLDIFDLTDVFIPAEPATSTGIITATDAITP